LLVISKDFIFGCCGVHTVWIQEFRSGIGCFLREGWLKLAI
jgi:hypothetical protein